jgi:hypothetical protein
MNHLPPFPTDPTTLDLLTAALNPRSAGDTLATRSCVGEFLELVSAMVGTGHDDDGLPRCYHEHDVIVALLAEVRRLRST